MVERAATMTVGNDLFLAAWAFSGAAASTGSCSSSTREFNLKPAGPTQLPLFSSGLVPSSQSAQVPSQVMI